MSSVPWRTTGAKHNLPTPSGFVWKTCTSTATTRGLFSSVFLFTRRDDGRVALGLVPHNKRHPGTRHKTIARDIELSVFWLIEYAAQHVGQLSCLFVKFRITHYFPRRITV